MEFIFLYIILNLYKIISFKVYNKFKANKICYILKLYIKHW